MLVFAREAVHGAVLLRLLPLKDEQEPWVVSELHAVLGVELMSSS